MSKLEDLYEGKIRLERAGYKMPKEMLHDMASLEEQLIKDEVLPTLSKDIEPLLTKIQRELVLVVEYKPGVPISVSLSRKRNITQLIDDAKLLEIDPEVEHGTITITKKKDKREPKTNIRVYYDGRVFKTPVAADTFVDVIEAIGVARVRSLGLIWNKIPLVSTTEDKKYSQRKSGQFYIITHSPTESKRAQLMKIANKLGLNIKVEIIAQDGSIVSPKKRERKRKRPQQNSAPKEAVEDNSLRGRYVNYVMQEHKKRTAKWYAGVLDKQVRSYIAQLVDSEADSIYSYKTAEEVRTCIELLKESEEFMADNKSQRNVMTAALNKYHQFMLNNENKKE